MKSKFATGFRLRRQRKKRKKFIKILFFIFIGVISLYLFFNQFIKNRANDSVKIVTPLVPSIAISSIISPTAAQTIGVEANSLKEVVDNTLKGTEGTYGIAIKNLKSGETYYINEHKVFDTGSLYKLWIMAIVYKQIQNGQLKENQVLSSDAAILNQKFNIASDSAEQTEGTITLPIYEALNQMITISDNYAALLLTEKIKLSSMVTFLKENGFSESVVGTNRDDPKATPFDISLFFEKLYKGKLANQQYTDEMINLLKNQKLNDGLPKYLPDKANIANKTGEIDLFKHDAGIVFTDKGDYIIVVMSESKFPLDAQERIALISKGVFDYFTNK